jgi:hypothetical protein
MRTLAICGLVSLFASGLLLAQRRGVGTTAGTNAGYGNVVFPGGRPSITTPFSQTNTFSPAFGSVVNGNTVGGRSLFNGFNGNGLNGFNGFNGFNGGRRNNNGNSNSVVYVPFAYPVYGGGGGYYGGGYGDPGAMPIQQQPNVTIIYPPQQTPMMMMGPQPPVPNGQIRDYMPPMPPDQASAETAPQQRDADYYLLAFKDHSIYSAIGYWVDGDTVHYITTGNVHNQVSVSLVDRDLTIQLNKGRGVQVNLPPSR